MEYNQPSEIVKDVNFGDNAKNKIVAGVEKLAKAVKWFIENETTGLYQLTNGKFISKHDLLHLFKKYTKKNIEIQKVNGTDTSKSFLDTRKEINYPLPEYNEMVRDMVISIKNNRILYKHYNL